MRKQWLSRGGSMVWVAVFMLAIPPMILALVNSVRLVQAVYTVRNAVSTGCLAGSQEANFRYYRNQGEVYLYEQAVRIVSGHWWLQATQGLSDEGVISAREFNTRIARAADGRGVSVTCTGAAEYRVWGVDASVPLRYETTVETLFNPVPEQP